VHREFELQGAGCGARANTQRSHPGTPSGYVVNKALASGYREGGWLLRAWIQGRLHEVGMGCRNPAKGAMRHFWDIANRGIVACAGKIFWGKRQEKF